MDAKTANRIAHTLTMIVDTSRDPHSTVSGIFNDAVLDDLEMMRDELALARRNAIALRLNEEAPAAHDGNQDGEGEAIERDTTNSWMMSRATTVT